MQKQTLAKKPRCFLTYASALIGAFVLLGCVNPYGYTVVPKNELIRIESGIINVSPPSGFCKDARSSTNTETSAVLLFADCGYLNSNGKSSARTTGFSGIVTTSIAKTAAFNDNSSVTDMSDFLSSREGIDSFSLSEKTASIIDKRKSSNAVFLQIRDPNAALSENVWKSFLNRSNYLVTVTLQQNENSRLTDEQVMQFLQRYSETIQMTDNQVAFHQASQTQQTANTTAVQNENHLKKVGLLRRLLL